MIVGQGGKVPDMGQGHGQTTVSECIVKECGERRTNDNAKFAGYFCEDHTRALESCRADFSLKPKDMSRMQLESSHAWGNIIMLSALMQGRGMEQGRAALFVRMQNEFVYESFRRGYVE